MEDLEDIENRLIDKEMSTKGRLRKSYAKLDNNLRLNPLYPFNYYGSYK